MKLGVSSNPTEPSLDPPLYHLCSAFHIRANSVDLDQIPPKSSLAGSTPFAWNLCKKKTKYEPELDKANKMTYAQRTLISLCNHTV